MLLKLRFYEPQRVDRNDSGHFATLAMKERSLTASLKAIASVSNLLVWETRGRQQTGALIISAGSHRNSGERGRLWLDQAMYRSPQTLYSWSSVWEQN